MRSEQRRPLVYLSGTITPAKEHLAWRKEVTRKLRALGISVLDPIRGKQPADWIPSGLDAKTPTTYLHGGFVARDWRDVNRADAVLLVFQSAPLRQSIGTWTEYGWATWQGIPVVVCSTIPEVIEHPFVYRLAARVCRTLDEAIAYLAFLLS